MKVISLLIKNFLTIESALLELDDRGLLLIQGVNEDNPSARSNGAGKSSIVDALCWALFGNTARDLTGDAVVNRKAKKDCMVEVFLEDGADVYQIARYRKDSANKNELHIRKYASPPAAGPIVDMSKGTDKETQAVLESVIGCSQDVFMAAIYAGQEKMPDIPAMTDKMLKLLVEEAAGVEVLAKAHDIAKTRALKASGLVTACEAALRVATDGVANANANVAALEKSCEEFELSRRDRAKEELAKVLPLTKEVTEASATLLGVDEAGLQALLTDVDLRLAEQKTEQAKLDALRAEAGKASLNVASIKSTIQHAKTDMERYERQLASIDEQVGKPCGECGKTYHAEDLETAREARREIIAADKVKIAGYITSAKEALQAEKLANEAVEKFKAGMRDVSELIARQRELTARLNEIKSVKLRIELNQKLIDQLKASSAAKLTEENPWKAAVEREKLKLAGLEASVRVAEGNLEEAKKKSAIANDAVKVFGPAGVRAHILDTVTPFLNERTADYIGALTDGTQHIIWSTLTKTAKGEIREKFNIEVTDDQGGESFKALSGGEKRKARLACTLALQDLQASRASKPIDLWIGDEIDHALDEAGLERLMGILEKKARERGTVLVISHNALDDWITNVVTVTKKGGKSSVTGDTSKTV